MQRIDFFRQKMSFVKKISVWFRSIEIFFLSWIRFWRKIGDNSFWWKAELAKDWVPLTFLNLGSVLKELKRSWSFDDAWSRECLRLRESRLGWVWVRFFLHKNWSLVMLLEISLRFKTTYSRLDKLAPDEAALPPISYRAPYLEAMAVVLVVVQHSCCKF